MRSCRRVPNGAPEMRTLTSSPSTSVVSAGCDASSSAVPLPPAVPIDPPASDSWTKGDQASRDRGSVEAILRLPHCHACPCERHALSPTLGLLDRESLWCEPLASLHHRIRVASAHHVADVRDPFIGVGPSLVANVDLE